MADSKESKEIDYTLSNPDTVTKYKTAAQISNKVLAQVVGWCKAGETILSLCEKGDKTLEEEIAKVYKGKKIEKGISHPTTVSPSSFVTPYTPLATDTEEAATTLAAGDIIKVQLGAQIDGFATIVCDNVVVLDKDGNADKLSEADSNLLLAAHYANELFLRLILPPGLLATGTDEEKKKAQAAKPLTQSRISAMLEKVAESYGCKIVEGTTCWLFDRHEIESKKRIILSPGEGSKGDGIPEIGEVWGLEVGISAGDGKIKPLSKRTTLHRRTATTYSLKRPSSRQLLSEVKKKFGLFPFSLRQLEDEKAAKVGIVECVRTNVIRQYECVGDKDGAKVARLFCTVAITKNGLTKLCMPPPLDLSRCKTEKKIADEEILKLLEQPLSRSTGNKNKKKKKKPAKKTTAAADEEEESSDDE